MLNDYVWTDPRLVGVSVEVDAKAMAEVYSGDPMMRIWWCQCDGCSDYAEAAKEHFPLGLAQVLRSLSIDPLDPSYISRQRGPLPLPEEGWARFMGVYVLQGELLGATHTEPLFPERELGLLGRFLGATHTIPIYTDEGCWFSITKHLPPSQLDKPAPTLTVVFSLLLPWKYPTELVGEEEQDGDLGRFEAVEPEV